MTLSIYTNTQSLNSQRILANNSGTLQTTMQRLASGRRINSAADDAAGLAISTRMNAVSVSQNSINRGINDALGILQVAEGALGSISQLLQRGRELAVQASNGTLSQSDRNALHHEFAKIIQEIDRTSENTEIFGIKPLASNLPSTPISTVPFITDVFPANGQSVGYSSGIKPLTYIPAGSTNVSIQIDSYGMDDDLQVFTKDGKHLLGTNLGDGVWSANGINNTGDVANKVFSQAAFDSGASYNSSSLLDGRGNSPGNTLTTTFNGMSFSYSGDLHPSNTLESFTINQTSEDLLLFVVGSGSFSGSATANWSAIPPKPSVPLGPINIVLGSNHGSTVESTMIERTPADSNSLGLSVCSIKNQSISVASIERLDFAINKINDMRGYFGAKQAQLDSAQSNLKNNNVNTQAATARIVDADYSQEASNQQRSTILQNAGQSALAQANLNVKTVLELLKL